MIEEREEQYGEHVVILVSEESLPCYKIRKLKISKVKCKKEIIETCTQNSNVKYDPDVAWPLISILLDMGNNAA